MADSLFNFKARCPGTSDLPDVPVIGNLQLLASCDIPAPLEPVLVCNLFQLPAPTPVVNRALYITVSAGPVALAYTWAEAVPNGAGGHSTGSRSGSIAAHTGAYEINSIPVAPGPKVYPATLLGGTGKCTFIAELPESPIEAGKGIFLQLTSYNATVGAYDWRQVAPASPTTWSPTGVTGTATAGTGAYVQNGVPAPPDGTTVYSATLQGVGSGATAHATVAGDGTISGIVVDTPGTGYLVAPAVTITGGGGVGATATASLTGGGVGSVAMGAPGSGYVPLPIATITGDGTGATATVTVDGDGVSGLVLTAPGAGYTTATVAITGGGGSGATATVTLASGLVSGFTVTAPGSGYTPAPEVSIDPPPTVPVFAATNVGSAVVAFTPSGGIPAATSSTAPGSAIVEIFYVNLTTGLLVDSGIPMKMWNLDPTDAVTGSVYVQGKLSLGGALVHDWELCS